MTNVITAAIAAASLLVGSQVARAHCDSVDGPVAKAVEKALETGNVNTVLIYAPAAAEMESRGAFDKSRKVRGLGSDAKAAIDPKSTAEVPAARERVSAELGFVTFAETIRQAALGKGAEHHE